MLNWLNLDSQRYSIPYVRYRKHLKLFEALRTDGPGANSPSFSALHTFRFAKKCVFFIRAFFWALPRQQKSDSLSPVTLGYEMTIYRRFIGLLNKGAYSLLVLISAVNLLTACSLAPSDAELVRAITTNDTLNGRLYQIQNFRRTNGYKTRTGYAVEFNCEIYILEDSADYFNRLTKSGNNPVGAIAAFGLAAEGIAKWGLFNAALLTTYKKGDNVPFSGSITMIKSEQGWIPNPEPSE